MGRPVKNTADYFPHFCGDGSTKFIINERFGNDGYAIWIKTLELLTFSENHVFDFNNPSKRLFLSAKMGVPDDTLQEIYLLFVQLGILDSKLFKLGVLWCEELVESLRSLYDRRKKQLPDKCEIYAVYGIQNKVNVNRNSIKDVIKPQSIGEDRIGKQSKENDSIPELTEINTYFLEKGSDETNAERFFNFYESKGWLVGKSEMKKWRAAASNWISRSKQENGLSDWDEIMEKV